MSEPPKPLFVAHDNRDDRSESHRQLCTLDNVEGLGWLTVNWAGSRELCSALWMDGKAT